MRGTKQLEELMTNPLQSENIFDTLKKFKEKPDTDATRCELADMLMRVNINWSKPETEAMRSKLIEDGVPTAELHKLRIKNGTATGALSKIEELLKGKPILMCALIELSMATAAMEEVNKGWHGKPISELGSKTRSPLSVSATVVKSTRSKKKEFEEVEEVDPKDIEIIEVGDDGAQPTSTASR